MTAPLPPDLPAAPPLCGRCRVRPVPRDAFTPLCDRCLAAVAEQYGTAS